MSFYLSINFLNHNFFLLKMTLWYEISNSKNFNENTQNVRR